MTLRQPLSPQTLDRAAHSLRAGRLVAFATETVYGLGGDAANPLAVARIFETKGRPRFNPLIAHFADAEAAFAVVQPDQRAQALATAFWPGPLTLVLPRRPHCPIDPLASAGLATQAVRVPRVSPDFRRLLAGFPAGIVAPSANPSGRLSPTSAEHVEVGFLGRQREHAPEHLALILDDGPCPAGLESTVVDLSDARQPRLLRHGAIAQVDIETVLGQALTLDTDPAVKTAPGQMTRHYAPGAPLILNAETATPDQAALVFADPAGFEAASALEVLSPNGSTTEAAAGLFAALHRLDALGPSAIAVGPVPMTGLGEAINDRLRRAAAGSAPNRKAAG
ncbi:MAG: L-threonylcarbamoyladenylate synthase [Pseudomonadota bacterium]|nr:L-threonylcarbamoyladenylate synthase [Pseudomonadota bacterium]